MLPAYRGKIPQREDTKQRGLSTCAIADDDEFPVSTLRKPSESVVGESVAPNIPSHHLLILRRHDGSLAANKS
jgi:hypothetical protein